MECFTQPKYRLLNKEGFVLIPPQALNNGWHRIDIQQIFAKLDSPENLSDPGIKPTSLVSPELADWFFTTNTTWEATTNNKLYLPIGSRTSANESWTGVVPPCIHSIPLYAVRKAGQLKSTAAPRLLEISGPAQHGHADPSLYTHLLPSSPDKWSKNGTHIFEHPNPNERCGPGNDSPAASRCEIQTLPHVWNNENKKNTRLTDVFMVNGKTITQ